MAYHDNKGAGHKRGPVAPKVIDAHPPHMRGGKTQDDYKAKHIEPKGGKMGHGHTEHKGK